jgi:hypothetical protein
MNAPEELVDGRRVERLSPLRELSRFGRGGLAKCPSHPNIHNQTGGTHSSRTRILERSHPLPTEPQSTPGLRSILIAIDERSKLAEQVGADPTRPITRSSGLANRPIYRSRTAPLNLVPAEEVESSRH